MKKIFLICSAALGFLSGRGQDTGEKLNNYSIGAQYTHEFVLGGYVRVREWELHGDKMKLRDLGMTSYAAIQLRVEKQLKKNRSISLTYDQYFMRGSATVDRDITYNGTIIDGRKGIDVSPTRYYRVSAIYRGALYDRGHLHLKYTGALVFDHIVFYLDGEVTSSSPKDEVYEGFGRQAFPYPVVGLQGKYDLKRMNRINLEVSGTYIPSFKSFYSEGGRVHLQYSTFMADLSYTHTISSVEINAGAKLRYMHLFQESKEDTNIISTLTAGPYLGIVYHF
jgi:hypothetical protein